MKTAIQLSEIADLGKFTKPVAIETVPSVQDFVQCLQQGQFEYWTTSATGVVIAAETPENKLREFAQNVALMWEATGVKHAQASMMMGDILRHYENKYGETYADLIDSTRQKMRVGVKSLSNWMWIAGKVPLSRRREGVSSLAIYEAVAKLKPEEQSKYLQLADEESMTVRELRAKIAEEYPKTPVNASKSTNGTSVAQTPNKLDISDPEAVTEALEALANLFTRFPDDVSSDWIVPLETIYSFWKKYR